MPRHAAASHILVKTELIAKDVVKRLEKGEPFDKLAQRFSTCPSSTKGGDLGEFKKGDMVKPFDQAVFAHGSEDQAFIGPIKTKFGFHLIKVLYKD